MCGNGGSAADAQHLAAEFLVRLKPNINRNPIPAIALALDTSTITLAQMIIHLTIYFPETLKPLERKMIF